MPDPASAFLVDRHLVTGDGWVLSQGRLAVTEQDVLLVSHSAAAAAAADLAEDLVDLRRRLAVAGSVAAAHLASVVSADRSADGVVVAVSAPGGPSLATLVASRGLLAVGEVVTLVAPLATTLGALHSRGIELSDVTTATVWLAPDGRPVLVPVGIRCRAVESGELACADVAALAAMALGLLDPASSGSDALVTALQAAADARLDAVGLAAAVLRSAPAMPLGAATPARSPGSSRAGRSSRRRPALRTARRPGLRAAAVVCTVVVGIVLGGLWGRHDGGTVLAAPPPRPPSAASPAPASGEPAAAPDGVPSWRAVMTTLERARARAYATGDPASLSAVYADGSPTGRADLQLLRRLARHGQHTAGLQAFVEGVDVVTVTDARATLRVSDALTAYDVVAPDAHVVKRGHGRPSRDWTITLVRTPSGWRIWSVRA